MQRIVLGYRKDTCAVVMSHSALRTCLQQAAEAAKLPIADRRHPLVMGPPLPTNATGASEQAVLELDAPYDPAVVRDLLNANLPDGVRVEQAWIARPGMPDDNPSTLDEAIYEVDWPGTVPVEQLRSALRQFLSSREVPFTRKRDAKVQHFNARALVRDIAVLSLSDNLVRLRMILSVGPQGSLRPDEVLQLLGCAPTDGTRVHRLGLLRSAQRTTTMRPADLS